MPPAPSASSPSTEPAKSWCPRYRQSCVASDTCRDAGRVGGAELVSGILRSASVISRIVWGAAGSYILRPHADTSRGHINQRRPIMRRLLLLSLVLLGV